MRVVILLLVGFALGCSITTASAQTVDPSPARLRAENRKALRESRKYKSEYKDSHLAVNRHDLRRSQTRALPQDGRGRLQFDHTGTAKVSEPSRVNLRLGKKKKYNLSPEL
ncbi:hypothetical protein SAMN00120144_2076 [Hymenobacter roseosalivarius DSM 11622]|uniref:Uncharacterized protein n=1 Tax=Hymenobacter roseosalivarius DSM 11622 TaxID=645990 RepID=A0A1W1VN80_9BACT|nr:hypothetical protein [Hymenobacter roseosalivarius]SMB94786.1 hypothetical protein SAMN00120144_2076 [Hymenobacter roseosalivarius DSM 11622]